MPGTFFLDVVSQYTRMIGSVPEKRIKQPSAIFQQEFITIQSVEAQDFYAPNGGRFCIQNHSFVDLAIPGKGGINAVVIMRPDPFEQ